MPCGNIPLCFMRLATTFLQAPSTTYADRQTARPIQRVVHALLVGREVVDLALEVVALLLAVAATGVQVLQFLDYGGHAPLAQQAAPALEPWSPETRDRNSGRRGGAFDTSSVLRGA